LKELGLTQDLFTINPENEGVLEPLYLAFSINTPDEIVIRYQKAYKEIIQNGTINSIQSQ
jgi:hypothetical protein